MAIRRWYFFPLLATLAMLAGCNGGSTFNVQNPSAPSQSSLSIVFQPSPVQTVNIGFTASFTAVVSNDPNNYGVDWNLVCPANVGAGNCGTLSATHTASGASVVYTPPSILTTASLTGINIEAFATADHTQNVFSSISVNSFDSGLRAGNYVLQAQGSQGGSPYQIVAVVTLDGQGNITAGEQTLNSAAQFVSVSDSIVPSGSSYFIGSDGRGTITLNDTAFGSEIFSLVFLNDGSQNPQALISQAGIDGTGAVSSGTMDFQTSTTLPTGSYAFVSSGIVSQFGYVLPSALGGIFTIDANNNVSGLSDEAFGSRTVQSGSPICTTPPCTVSAPDSFGKVTFNLTPGYGYLFHPVSVQFTGYVVDPSHVRLMESDFAVNPVPFGLTGGVAIAQSSGSAGNFTSSSLSGSYVFELTGVDLSPNNSVGSPSTLTSVGLFTSDGSLNLNNGFTDTSLLYDTNQNVQLGQQGAQISAGFSGTYSVDSTGRAALSLSNFSPAVLPSYSPTLIFYLTDKQNPSQALILESGPPPNYRSVATGNAYPRATSFSPLSGDYGISLTQVTFGGEIDATGQMTANSANAPALSGVADSLLAPPPPIDPTQSDHSFIGSLTSPQSNGLFTGTLADLSIGFPFGLGNYPSDFSVDYYPIDQDHGILIETDLVNSVPPANPPNPSGQVSIGYYYVRVPMCSGCP